MKKNAVILAAGKSGRFAPFTYEKPKGLFCVKGEVLIERQIEQLQAAGIREIYVVVGYMKEKYFYLEKKLGVQLIINNDFAKVGNFCSVYKAKEHLSNTFICCADHYFVDNPFLDANIENLSYRTVAYQIGNFREFAIKCSDANVITDVNIGGHDSLAMVGFAYFNDNFSRRFRVFMENEVNDFGISNMFWEEFFAKHIQNLTLFSKEFPADFLLEFDSIEDLRAFDSDFLLNVDSEIITNICSTLSCNANDITDIAVINAGLTNVSFSFDVCGKKYVYRHPGGTAGNLIDRNTEIFAQLAALTAGIDKSVIAIDPTGWKISHFVENAKNCDFENCDTQLRVAMDYLHKLHQIKPDASVKIFDNLIEGKKLMTIASATKGNLACEFSDIVKKVEKLYKYVQNDAERMGMGLVLCHNDTYAPNYLYDEQNNIYLIDWEYAGLNYAANDIGCILCRYDWTDVQIERYLKFYVGRNLTEDEKRFYYAFIPISGFYWFCWGLYKGSVGDDDSFFFLPAYHNTVRFIDEALESYEMERGTLF